MWLAGDVKGLANPPCSGSLPGEVKRKRFIDEGIVAEVEEKVRRLPLRKGLSARSVLVYDGELFPSVEGSGYFDSIINARQLLDV